METLEHPSYESFGFTQCRTTLCDETDALGFRFDTVFEQSKMNKQQICTRGSWISKKAKKGIESWDLTSNYT